MSNANKHIGMNHHGNSSHKSHHEDDDGKKAHTADNVSIGLAEFVHNAAKEKSPDGPHRTVNECSHCAQQQPCIVLYVWVCVSEFEWVCGESVGKEATKYTDA